MSAPVFNNDPNLHRYEGKVFRLTFGVWQYRWVQEATVFGNCKGFTNLDCAVDQVAERLEEGEWGYVVKLTNADGDTLHCDTEDDDVEEWLMANLVSVDLIGFTPPALQSQAPPSPVEQKEG